MLQEFTPAHPYTHSHQLSRPPLSQGTYIKNLKNYGKAPCLSWLLRDHQKTGAELLTIVRALLTLTIDKTTITDDTFSPSSFLTLSDAFYVAVKNDEALVAEAIFYHVWGNSRAKGSTEPGNMLLERCRYWNVFLLVLKERVADKKSSFMIRACEHMNDEMVTTLNRLRTMVRSELSVHAGELVKVLNVIHDGKDTLPELKDMMDRWLVDAEGTGAKSSGKKGDKKLNPSRALMEVDLCDSLNDQNSDGAYGNMNLGKFQEALDLVRACEALVEDYVFNFEAPAGVVPLCDDSFAPLHYACNGEEEMVESVRTLVKAKVNINAKGKYGITPLHVACLRGHVQVVETLLTYNANPAEATGGAMTTNLARGETVMNTLHIKPSVAGKVQPLQMAVHPRLYFSMTSDNTTGGEGAGSRKGGGAGGAKVAEERIVGDGEAGDAWKTFSQRSDMQEALLENLGILEYVRSVRVVSTEEAYNIARQGAFRAAREASRHPPAAKAKRETLFFVNNWVSGVGESHVSKHGESHVSKQDSLYEGHRQDSRIWELKRRMCDLFGVDEVSQTDLVTDFEVCHICLHSSTDGCKHRQKAKAVVNNHPMIRNLEEHFVNSRKDNLMKEQPLIWERSFPSVPSQEMLDLECQMIAWEELLDKAIEGSVVAIQNRAQRTPHCHLNVVKQLVARGASRQYKSADGRNALHLAYMNLKKEQDARNARFTMIRGVENKQKAAKATAETKMAEEQQGGHDDDSTDIVLTGPASEIISFLQIDFSSVDDLEEVLDNFDNPAFTLPQREEYYSLIAGKLRSTGDVNYLFEAKRTQSAVSFKWKQEIRTIRICALFLWIFTILIVLVLFSDHLGVLNSPALSMVQSVEEVLVFDEFDSVGDMQMPTAPVAAGGAATLAVPGANSFGDIKNLDHWWAWFENVALGATYSDPRPYRDANGELRMSPGGSFNGMTFPMGRPQLRQLRLRQSGCIRDKYEAGAEARSSAPLPELAGWVPGSAVEEAGVGVSKARKKAWTYASLADNTCFYHNNEETRNFTAGGKTYEYRGKVGDEELRSWGTLNSNLVAKTLGGTIYPGGGYTWELPEDADEAETQMKAMKDGHWIDLNTMAVFFEFSLYSANYNLVLVGRMTMELDNMGMVRTSHNFRTVKLKHDYMITGYKEESMYMQWTDRLRETIGWLYTVLMLYWAWEEMRNCCTCCSTCRSYDGIRFERERRRQNGEGAKMTLCDMAKANIKDYVFMSFNVLDIVMYLAHILYTALFVWSINAASHVDDLMLRHYDLAHNRTSSTGVDTATSAAAAAGTAATVAWGENKDRMIPALFEATQAHEVQKSLASVILLLMVFKLMEYVKINNTYAEYHYIVLGMFKKLISFLLLFLIYIVAFLLATYTFASENDQDLSQLISGFLTTFQRSFGDIDFAETRAGPNSFAMSLILLVFAVFVVLLLMNLMISIMSEAIESVQDEAKARWCFEQNRMLEHYREDKTERLPWALLLVFRFWYNAGPRCYNCCNSSRTGGEPTASVYYDITMKWKKSEQNRGDENDKLQASIAFEMLEYNHVCLQYSFGDRFYALLRDRILDTCDRWKRLNERFLAAREVQLMKKKTKREELSGVENRASKTSKNTLSRSKSTANMYEDGFKAVDVNTEQRESEADALKLERIKRELQKPADLLWNLLEGGKGDVKHCLDAARRARDIMTENEEKPKTKENDLEELKCGSHLCVGSESIGGLRKAWTDARSAPPSFVSRFSPFSDNPTAHYCHITMLWSKVTRKGGCCKSEYEAGGALFHMEGLTQFLDIFNAIEEADTYLDHTLTTIVERVEARPLNKDDMSEGLEVLVKEKDGDFWKGVVGGKSKKKEGQWLVRFPPAPEDKSGTGKLVARKPEDMKFVPLTVEAKREDGAADSYATMHRKCFMGALSDLLR